MADRRQWTRRGVLAAALGGSGAAAAALGDGSGNLYGGKMALSEAYNVSGDLWIGPDSAKNNVDANSGRVYMASDTQVEYYGDSGSWTLMGVGSEQQPVSNIHSVSVSTDVSRTKSEPVYNVKEWAAPDNGVDDAAPAIQDAIDAASADGGGTLYFPEPDTGYRFDTPVKPKDNVWYKGEAWPRLMAGDLGGYAMFDNRDSLSNARWIGLELDGSTGWTSTSTYSPGQKAIFARPGNGTIRDLWVQNCYVHDTPATALGIDSCINDWYLFNRIEGAGTDGETTGSNAIGVGVGEEDRAPTYIIGNTIDDTAEYSIILEQTGDAMMTEGSHVILGNTLVDFRIGVGVEQVRGAQVGFNNYRASSRSDIGLEIDAIDGSAPTDVAVGSETFRGTYNDTNWRVSDAAGRVSVSSWTQEGGTNPDIGVGSAVVRGVGKASAGVAGVPDDSIWRFAQPCLIRNVDDETLWRIQFNTFEQLSYGEPVDLTSASGSQDGQINFHDGTGTPPFGLAAWDGANSQWVSQVDGTAF